MAIIITAKKKLTESSYLHYLQSILSMLKIPTTLLSDHAHINTYGDVKNGDKALLFFDAKGVTWKGQIPGFIIELSEYYTVILTNVTKDSICLQSALLANIKGIMFDTYSPETQLKCIHSILDGELWYERKAVCNAFSHLLIKYKQPSKKVENTPTIDDIDYNLTKREKTIIKYIAKGAQNKEIAEQLFISDHTVKTHVYSAFKKTKSRNRIELVNWARQFYPDTTSSRY